MSAEISTQKPGNWYRGFIQGKTRIVIAWVFAIWLGLSARQAPAIPGIAVCFLGATLRFWASGHLRKDTRPAVGGPYAWIRNPLYLGTYLMAVGTAWSIDQGILLATVTVVFAAIYHFIILDEETKLRRIFGTPYERYLELVPRFFPRPIRASRESLGEVNPEALRAESSRFDWEIAMKNRAYEAYASFAGLIGGAWLISWIWQQFS